MIGVDRVVCRRSLYACFLALAIGCRATAVDPPEGPLGIHAPIAAGITGPLGTVMPLATPAQRAAFERGRALFIGRRTIADGLGPEYSGVSCAGCHERPTVGGGAGTYRDVYFAGTETTPGIFRFGDVHLEAEDIGASAGIVRLYHIPGSSLHGRSPLPSDVAVIAARNPTPLFGLGLLTTVSDDAILANADPDDRDRDGISGRVNRDNGQIGRFGTQAIAAGLEEFARVEVFLGLGLTVQLLDASQRAALPFPDPSSVDGRLYVADPADPIPDPEMSSAQFQDLLTFVSLLAGPELAPLDARSARGRRVFSDLGCARCHVPRMPSARGPLPLYSDLLVHDMGVEMGDPMTIEDAGANEFRTALLWGVAAVGPYLHDGRALTLDEAIRAHGGEATASRVAYTSRRERDRDALLAFLATLGGAEMSSPGMLAPDAPIPAVGELGGPDHGLDPSEQQRFVEGRAAFDRIFGLTEGLGSPTFNGDSCRACHFDPVIGGSGPLDVNVIRQAFADASGTLHVPESGSVAYRERLVGSAPDLPPADANVHEHRQTPPLFGLALLDEVSDAEILSREDPDDARLVDGISGRVGRSSDGRVGRFGWKSVFPHLTDFVREASSVELGLTVPPGAPFGHVTDADHVPDPELDSATLDRLIGYLHLLGAPRRGAIDAQVSTGAQVFSSVGCDACHVPALAGPAGPVPAYTDLLLHDVAAPSAVGIEEGAASAHEYRTAPLWGVRSSAPYMHTGEAATLDDAIRLHFGEATASRARFETLDAADRDALLAFLGSL